MKACSKCKELKADDCFRWRTEKRENKGNFKYLNNTCKKCDAEISRIRHEALKDIPEYKLQNRVRVKKYRTENADQVREQKKIQRQTESYKTNRKEYIKRNRGKIYIQERISKRKYYIKNRDELSDVYVGHVFVQKTGLARGEIPVEVLRAKRDLIKLQREIKNIKNAKK